MERWWDIGWSYLIGTLHTMNIFVLWKNEEGDLELVAPPLDRGIVAQLSHLQGSNRYVMKLKNVGGTFL